jgi:hypothetical protein
VPLSQAALAVLKPLAEARTVSRPDAQVFFSMRGDRVPLSDMTLTACLRRRDIGVRQENRHTAARPRAKILQPSMPPARP